MPHNAHMQQAMDDLDAVMRVIDELYPDVKEAAEKKLQASPRYRMLCQAVRMAEPSKKNSS